MLRGYPAIVLHRSSALYFRSNSIAFISTGGFRNDKLIKKTLLKGILRVD